MHELGIAQEVVTLVAERAGAARVTRVCLDIGRNALVLPDAIRFCFDLVSEGTVVEGATLEIREIPCVVRCQSCGSEFELEEPFGICNCGSCSLDWLSGDEISVKEMEIA